MIRVTPETYNQIESIQTILEGISKQDIVKQAIEALSRELLLSQTNEAFKALKKNKAAWNDELKEREEWNFLNDELKDE